MAPKTATPATTIELTVKELAAPVKVAGEVEWVNLLIKTHGQLSSALDSGQDLGGGIKLTLRW